MHGAHIHGREQLGDGIGKVINRDGSPACSTVVTLYPAGYDPIRDVALMRLSSDTTDATGAFRLKAFDSMATYSIVATKQKSGTNALITGIVPKGDTTRTPVAVLAVPGAIIAAVPDWRTLRTGMFTFREPGLPHPSAAAG